MRHSPTSARSGDWAPAVLVSAACTEATVGTWFMLSMIWTRIGAHRSCGWPPRPGIISMAFSSVMPIQTLEFITIWVILCPPREEGQPMLRYRDLPTHTTDVLDLTSLTMDEFAALVPPFEAAFLEYMGKWTLHGRRRQARRYTTYRNSP